MLHVSPALQKEKGVGWGLETDELVHCELAAGFAGLLLEMRGGAAANGPASHNVKRVVAQRAHLASGCDARAKAILVLREEPPDSCGGCGAKEALSPKNGRAHARALREGVSGVLHELTQQIERVAFAYELTADLQHQVFGHEGQAACNARRVEHENADHVGTRRGHMRARRLWAATLILRNRILFAEIHIEDQKVLFFFLFF
jgi:hypothetical protein